jgi:hypothetical protein
MDTWHKRLEMALTARNRGWIDLFAYLNKETGISKPSVYAWKPDSEKRSTMMNGDNAALVCGWLAINPMWLFHNKGPSGLEDESSEKRIVRFYKQLSETRKAVVEQTIQGFVALELSENAAHIADFRADPKASERKA